MTWKRDAGNDGLVPHLQVGAFARRRRTQVRHVCAYAAVGASAWAHDAQASADADSQGNCLVQRTAQGQLAAPLAAEEAMQRLPPESSSQPPHSARLP